MKHLSSALQSNRAFSLVEVLVSITILLLAAVLPMTVVTRANNSTAYANEQMVAFFLAQEGLELVEKGRNDFYLQYFKREFGSSGINNPMAEFTKTTGTSIFRYCITDECGIGITSGGTIPQAIRCLSANNNCRLYYDSSSPRSKYVHGGASPGASQKLTPYTRKIKLEPVIDSGSGKLRDVKVTSTVTWRTGSLIAGQSVTLITYLSNIYDTY